MVQNSTPALEVKEAQAGSVDAKIIVGFAGQSRHHLDLETVNVKCTNHMLSCLCCWVSPPGGLKGGHCK